MKRNIIVALLLFACSCVRERPDRYSLEEGHDVTAPSKDELPIEIRRRSVGQVFFGVGGGRNDRTKEFEFDPAYRLFFVTLVRGEEAFQWGTGGNMFIIGIDSPQGVAFLRVLNAEAPWKKKPEDIDVFANHLVFAGELNGRKWEYSRSYPDPAIDRIVRSLRPILDRVPSPPPASTTAPRAGDQAR